MFFLNVFNDIPKQSQYGFQNPMTIFAELIFDLHNIVMIILAFLVGLVGALLYEILITLPAYSSPSILPNVLNDKNNSIINRQFLLNIAEANILRRINSGPVIEFIWTTFPCILLLFISIPSFSLMYYMDEVEAPSSTIKVIGNQWYWTYDVAFPYAEHCLPFTIVTYDSYLIDYVDLNIGQYRLLQVDAPLVIPSRTDIRFLVTASDVLHSFAVPSFGIKIDAVPGRLNQVFVFAKREGVAFGQCSELCGVDHYAMPIMVYVFGL